MRSEQENSQLSSRLDKSDEQSSVYRRRCVFIGGFVADEAVTA